MAWIAGDRVVLRAWERDDIRVRWETDQTADATEQRLRDWHEPPKSLQQREAEFDALQGEPDLTTVALIIEADGRAVGDINLFHIDQRNRCASIGLSIWCEDDRGHGYGTSAMRALLGWAFGQMNLNRVELSVAPDNTRAMKMYEHLGFTHEGRRREAHFEDGRYVDDVMMGILSREYEARSRAPQA